MNIAIVTNVDILIPGAVRNRLISYARGIAELGSTVHMLWLGNSSGDMLSSSYEYSGVRFYGLSNDKSRSANLLKPFIAYRSGKKVAQFLDKEHAKQRVDVLIFYGILVPERIPIVRKCRKFGILMVDEITEYPYLGREKKPYRKLQYFLFMRFFAVQDAAILCISHGIARFMRDHLQRLNSPAIVKLFGIMVESDKFTCPLERMPSTENFGDYIAYCGSMYGDKDGVPDLIEAFSAVILRFPALKLVIMGDNSNKDKMQDILERIRSFNLESRIVFTGRINWEEMHALLCAAKALVLAKPDNKQNEGAFPTKLGEYLACGRPVVTTAVGDIPLYLKDGENCYLAEPGNPSAFAEKILECLNDQHRAREIGNNGRKLAETVFNYKICAADLLGFFQELVLGNN